MSDTPTTMQLTVKGMTCGHCVRAVTNALTAIDPQAQVLIDLPSGRVEVSSTASAPAIRAAIVEEGYEILAS